MISPAAIPWPKHSSRGARLLYFVWKNFCLVCVVPMSICYELAMASYNHTVTLPRTYTEHPGGYIDADLFSASQPRHIESMLYIPVKLGVECDNGIHRGDVVQGFQWACSQINFSPAGMPHPLVTWLTTIRLFCMAGACRTQSPCFVPALAISNLLPVINF